MRNFLTIIFITSLLLLSLEALSRLFIYISYGDSEAGVKERTVNLSYNPFIMWGPNFDEDSANFVINNGVDKEDFVILILGGSTAGEFSKNTIGEGTIENAFSKFLINNNQKLYIFNTAVGGFNIRQEISALMITVEKINPDLIIIIDGASDVQHALRPGVIPGTTFVDQTYKTVITKPYLGPMVYLIQRSQFINGLSRLINRFNLRKDNFDEHNINKTIDLYLESRNFIHKYAKGSEIKTIFMLQPHVVFSSNISDINAKKRFKYRSSIVKESFNKISNSKYSQEICFVDANKKIIDENLSIDFIDDVHFKNNKGYYYMAELLADTYEKCYE